MKKFLIGFFIFIFFILFAEIGYYLYVTKTSTKQKNLSYNPYQLKQSRLEEIEGKIIRWKDILFSDDKYITLLTDNNITYTGRVVFDKEALYAPMKIATGLARRKKGKKRNKDNRSNCQLWIF